MSKKAKKSARSTYPVVPGFSFVQESGGIAEYTLKKNGLTVLYKHIPDTGVVTTNITYRVGSRDEAVGETGLAHMLEHMLFKPTKKDIARKTDASAMQFERNTGSILNANTWRDRTTYFFSYPRTHASDALQIEAERMQGVVLTDAEFQPERGNVLSEFDMYFGDPQFALTTAMAGCAFHSHPYGHETIGFREDIERYTVEKLEQFYRSFYRPDNATLMVIGDISVKEALSLVKKHSNTLTNPPSAIPRHTAVEPRQEGIRRVEIKRDSTTNLLAIGVKHEAFPHAEWFDTAVLFDVLAGRTDSVLHTELVDAGLASNVEYMVEPTGEQCLGVLYITLAHGVSHSEVEKKVLNAIRSLQAKTITRDVKKAVQSMLTNELFARDSSLGIAMELTEHVAAGDWKTFIAVPSLVQAVTPKRVAKQAAKLFETHNLTIGYFIGSK